MNKIDETEIKLKPKLKVERGQSCRKEKGLRNSYFSKLRGKAAEELA
jgi:hypothetical protein